MSPGQSFNNLYVEFISTEGGNTDHKGFTVNYNFRAGMTISTVYMLGPVSIVYKAFFSHHGILTWEG